MYLIEVIPIQSGTKKPLTYYSKAQLLRGALVEIEIRSKKTTGIVASVQPASSARSNLRTSSYQIKKISKIIQERPVALHILTVAESVSDKTLAPASKILEKLVPEWTWSSDHYLNNYKPDTDSDELLYEYLVFQAPQKERMTYYRTMVREMLAKKKTLLIVVPTYAHIERYYSFLEKGVGNRIIQLHGKLTQKKITEAYTKLKKDTGWIVLATPSMSMYPLPSLGKILLDTESHSTYHTMARPFLDLRYVFQSRAMYQNIPIIFAGSFVSLSHHLSLEDGTARALRPVISRVEFPHSIERVIPGDPAQKKHPPVKKNDEFMMLEKPIHEKLKKIREQGESVLVFVSRKGLAPVTVCQDCRNVLRAPETGVPLVLIKSKNGRRKFRDPKTGQEYPANTVC
ncbi:MAG: hypothetical protein OEX08_02950, partial [Candidatus Nomurabacteria bacterium]|nr:hypothetical protein [Candidatus Nomurabacteria bacterium]